MGIAWLLLKRTFSNRPKRTLLFIFGYALATAVMITLLSVGEAVLLQAQDKDLLGGGDIVMVPQGIDIESMKVGGISALYYSIPQARFIVRQLLGSSRFQEEISNISPYITSKLLYIRKKSTANSPVEAVYADGSLPDEERMMKHTDLPWRNSDEDKNWLRPDLASFYHEMDRFHLPSAPSAPMDQWAEWHYFNFEGDDFYGYLSIMVTGDILNDQAKWILSIQIQDRGKYHQYESAYPAKKSELPLSTINYRIGQNTIQFVKDHYELNLNFEDVPVRGQIQFFPNPRLYLPPVVLARSNDFESGYVIPALRGTYRGNLEIGRKKYDMGEAQGYHDHNWGIWQQPRTSTGQPVYWNWGHAHSKDFSFLFGEIFLAGKSRGLFCAVFDNKGFLAMFRPQQIEFSNYKGREEGIQVPGELTISQSKVDSSIQLTGREVSSVARPVGNKNALYFIQYKMDYKISFTLDGKNMQFPARGNAETFVNKGRS
jgi:hypothetical protein